MNLHAHEAIVSSGNQGHRKSEEQSNHGTWDEICTNALLCSRCCVLSKRLSGRRDRLDEQCILHCGHSFLRTRMYFSMHCEGANHVTTMIEQKVHTSAQKRCMHSMKVRVLLIIPRQMGHFTCRNKMSASARNKDDYTSTLNPKP